MITETGSGKARARDACILALGACSVLAGLYAWARFWREGGPAGSEGIADVMRYYIPNLLFSRDALLRGGLPLWNPDEMLGMPMFATLEYGPLYPPNWLFLVLPCRAARLLVGSLHLWMFAVFMFLYLRRSLRLGSAAAFCGAVVVAFSEWSVLHLCALPDTYNSAVWLPLILLLTDRLLETPGPTRAAALGGMLALQLFAGEAEISARTGLLLVLYGVFRIGHHFSGDRSGRRAILSCAWLGAAALFSLGFSAIQILPTAELSLGSVRGPGALSFSTAFGESLGTHADLLRRLITGSTAGNLLFIGLPALVLAVYALVRPRAEAVFFLLFGAVILELLRGTASVISLLYFNYVPTGSWFQTPVRFAPFLLLSVAVLAALGAQRLLDNMRTATAKRRPSPSSLLLVLLGGLAAFAADRAWSGFDTSVALLSFVVMGLLMAVSLLPRPGPQATKAWPVAVALVPALTLLVCAWKSYPVSDFNIPKEPDLTGLAPEMRTFLREHATQGQRIYADYALDEGRRVPKLGPLLGVACLNGQSPFTLPEFFALYNPSLTPRVRAKGSANGGATTVGLRGGLSLADGAAALLNLTGVRYLVLGMGNEFFGTPRLNWLDGLTLPPAFRLLSRNGNTVIFENRNAWPRAFVVQREQPKPDFTRLPEEDTPAAEITEYRAQSVTVRPPRGKAGLLVLTDQYYPGWKAYADGTPRPIERIWQNFRGVRLTGMEKEIVFRYRPWTLYAGTAISAATCMAAGALVLTTRKRADDKGPKRRKNETDKGAIV
jgi:hypothetical protein